MTDPEPDRLEELEQLFHQATEHFHHCRKQLEEAMDASEFRHEERVEAAEDRLREAERAVEDVEARISRWLAANK